MDMNDEQLACRAQAGDRAAYGQLVKRRQHGVYTLALRMAGDRTVAEDLAQAAFVRIFEQLSRYDPARPFTPWMYQVAVNLMRNELKAGDRKPDARAAALDDGAPAADAAPGPEAAATASEEAEELAGKLQMLQPKLREAVVLRYYVDLSFEDIAGALGVTVSTAKMRVYRGLDALRRAYGAPGK